MTPDPYQPHITLGGRRLPETAIFTDLTPLADFTINWGAADWFTNVEPATATVHLLDPFGALLDLTSGAGVRLIITRDDPNLGPESVQVFDGHTITATAEWITLADPKTGKSREVWLLTLIANDQLGPLSQDRAHGPYYPSRELAEQQLHWGPQTMPERKATLGRRSGVPIEWKWSWLDLLVTPTRAQYPIAAYERKQNVSALTVLQQTARAWDVLARPYFDPQRGTIRFISPSAEGLATYIDPDTADLNVSRGELLPGSQFLADSGIRVSSSAFEQLMRIEVERRYETAASDQTPSRMEMVSVTEQHTIVSNAPTQATYSVKSDLSHLYTTDASITWWLTVGDFIGGIYGRAQNDPLVWRPTVDNFTREHAHWFLSPFPPLNEIGQPAVFGLRGSLTNWPPQTGPFAIVGGELRYTASGWEARLYPAAVPAFGAPTLGDLTAGHQLSDFAPDLFIADLQKITVF